MTRRQRQILGWTAILWPVVSFFVAVAVLAIRDFAKGGWIFFAFVAFTVSVVWGIGVISTEGQ